LQFYSETYNEKSIRLDPHADTGALTSSADWIKRYFSVAFSSYLSLSLIFY